MMARENELGRALRWHREQHEGCGATCQEYLEIAREYTEVRSIREGPLAPFSWLSIQEA